MTISNTMTVSNTGVNHSATKPSPRFTSFVLACLALGFFAPAKAQSMMDQMIMQRCSAAMQADYQKAGQTPAPGLVDKTCSCVVKQMDATHNIQTAKTICTSQLTGS